MADANRQQQMKKKFLAIQQKGAEGNKKQYKERTNKRKSAFKQKIDALRKKK